jgi:hypothetical protein
LDRDARVKWVHANQPVYELAPAEWNQYRQLLISDGYPQPRRMWERPRVVQFNDWSEALAIAEHIAVGAVPEEVRTFGAKLPSRSSHKWTDDEIQHLRDLWARGATLDEAAIVLRRTREAIAAKSAALAFPTRWKYRPRHRPVT